MYRDTSPPPANILSAESGNHSTLRLLRHVAVISSISYGTNLQPYIGCSALFYTSLIIDGYILNLRLPPTREVYRDLFEQSARQGQ
jgi:hypothetical protein